MCWTNPRARSSTSRKPCTGTSSTGRWRLPAGYIREINQRWSRVGPYRDTCDPAVRCQALIDAFHMVRVAAVLMHLIAPEGTEKVRAYLRLGEEFWSWERIFESLYTFMEDPAEHRLEFLEPRVDFFEKHPSQVRD